MNKGSTKAFRLLIEGRYSPTTTSDDEKIILAISQTLQGRVEIDELKFIYDSLIHIPTEK